MNKQDFLVNGYKEHPCSRHEESWCKLFLQKRITDADGTRYFINVYFARSIDGLEFQPVAKVQFELTNATTNIDLFRFESIDEMELYFAQMFIATDAYHYERY